MKNSSGLWLILAVIAAFLFLSMPKKANASTAGLTAAQIAARNAAAAKANQNSLLNTLANLFKPKKCSASPKGGGSSGGGGGSAPKGGAPPGAASGGKCCCKCCAYCGCCEARLAAHEAINGKPCDTCGGCTVGGCCALGQCCSDYVQANCQPCAGVGCNVGCCGGGCNCCNVWCCGGGCNCVGCFQCS